jgi:LCP family protein required for cell wall assembly
MNALSPRLFLRRFLIALLVSVVITSVAIAAAYAQAEQKVASVAEAKIDPAVLKKGGNFLLIGSDTRAFVDSAQEAEHFGSKETQTGQRSDTMMVAHVDPGSGTAYLVSFPRDLWVEIPGQGGAKINAAFNAGPQRVIETIESEFDVPISHYLEVDFSGFSKIVDALGTIPIYFPHPARDKMTGLAIPTAGCHQLDGNAALAFVRSRYYEEQIDGQWRTDPTSDLGRITRQQYFLRTLASQTLHEATAKPWKASALADTVLENLARDPKLGFGDLRGLAYAFRQPGGVQTVTLPTKRQFIQGQDALVLDDAKAAPMLARLRGAGDSVGKTAVPAGVEPADVRIAVRNGSGRNGLGATVVASLQELDFAVLPPATNADRSDYVTTEVRYAPGAQSKGQYVLAALGGVGKLVELGDGESGGAEVVLVLGQDYQSVSRPNATPTTAKPANPGATAAPNNGAAATTTTVPAIGC